MKLKRVSALVLSILLLLLPLGCWDRRELEEQAYVVALGQDLANDGSSDLIVTAQIVIPSKLAAGGNGGGEGKSFYQISMRGKSMFSALDAIQSVVARKLTLLQCRALIVSESYARQGVLPILQLVSRHPELRRTMLMAVVPGNVSDFLKKNEPKVHNNITKYWEEMASLNKYTSYGTMSTFQKVMEGVETLGENPIAALGNIGAGSLDQGKFNSQAGELPREGGTAAEFIGVAVFKKDRMVGKLGKMEAEALNLLVGDWRQAQFEFYDPYDSSKIMGVNLRQTSSPRISVDISSDPIKLEVKLFEEATLLSQDSVVDYTIPEERVKLEQTIKDEIETRSLALIKRAQTEFDADIFRFGNQAVKKKFLTWKEWQNFKWDDKFPKAEITVSPEVHVRWFGDQRGPVKPAS